MVGDKKLKIDFLGSCFFLRMVVWDFGLSVEVFVVFVVDINFVGLFVGDLGFFEEI